MKLSREKALTLTQNIFYNTDKGTGSNQQLYRLGIANEIGFSFELYFFR